MSFRGLDFSPGLNAYAELLRQADMDARKMQRQEELDRMSRYKAGLQGYPVEEDLYVPIADPGIAEEEVYAAAAQRGPAAEPSTADLINRLKSPEGQAGVANINKAAKLEKQKGLVADSDAPRAKLQGPAMDNLKREWAQYSKMKQEMQGQKPTPDEAVKLVVRDLVKDALVSGKAKVDTNGRYIVSPDLAKEIKEIREYARKQMLKGESSSSFDKLLEFALKKDITPQKPDKPPRGPSKLSIINSQIRSLDRDISNITRGPLYSISGEQSLPIRARLELRRLQKRRQELLQQLESLK